METEDRTNEQASDQTDKDASNASQPSTDKQRPSDDDSNASGDQHRATANPFATLLQYKRSVPTASSSDMAPSTPAASQPEDATTPADLNLPEISTDRKLPQTESIAGTSSLPQTQAEQETAAENRTPETDTNLSEIRTAPAANWPQSKIPNTLAHPLKNPEDTGSFIPLTISPPTPLATGETPQINSVADAPQPIPRVPGEISQTPTQVPDLETSIFGAIHGFLQAEITAPTKELSETSITAFTKDSLETPISAPTEGLSETPITAAIQDLLQTPISPPPQKLSQAPLAAPIQHSPQISSATARLSAIDSPSAAQPSSSKTQNIGQRMVDSVARKTYNAIAALGLGKLSGFGSDVERLRPLSRDTNQPPTTAPTTQQHLSETPITAAIESLLQAPISPPPQDLSRASLATPTQSSISAGPASGTPSSTQPPTTVQPGPLKPQDFGQRVVQSVASRTYSAIAALGNLTRLGSPSERLTPERRQGANQLPITAPPQDLSNTPITAAIQDLLEAPITAPTQGSLQPPATPPTQNLSPAPTSPPIPNWSQTATSSSEPGSLSAKQGLGQRMLDSMVRRTHTAIAALEKLTGLDNSQRLTPEPTQEADLEPDSQDPQARTVESETEPALRIKRAQELEARERARETRKNRLTRDTSEQDHIDARETAERVKAGMAGVAATQQQSKSGKFLRQHKTAITAVTIVMFTSAAAFVFYQERTKDTLIEKAEQALQSQHFTQAQQAADQGLTTFPKEALFHFYRGQALAGLAHEKVALDELTLAQNGRRDDLKITAARAKLQVQLGQLQPALAAYKQLIDGQFGDKAFNFASKATVELLLGNAKDALADINVAVKLHPGSGRFLRDRALIYAQLHDYEKALNDWNEVISKHPQDATAYAERGYVEFAAKRTAKALADFSHSMKIGSSPKAYYCRGLIRADLKENALAISDFNSALQLIEDKPKSAFDPANLVAMINAVDVLRERAKVHVSTGDYRQACDDLQKAIQKGADSPDVRLHLAECDEKLGNYLDAYSNYSAAIKQAPEQVDLYLKRAAASIKQHRYDLAERDFQSAIIQNPNNLTAYLSRGTAYADQKRYDDAYSDFNHVLRVEPNNTEARRQLALIAKLKRSSTIQVQPSAVAPEEVSSTTSTQAPSALPTPMQPSALGQLPLPSGKVDEVEAGYQMLTCGKLEGAIKDFMLAVRKNPNNVEARRYLANALAMKGQTSDAIKQFEVVSSLSALSVRDSLTLTTAYEVSGNKQAAAVLFQRLTRGNPTDELLRLELAKIYTATGDVHLLRLACAEGMRLAKTQDQIAQFNQLLQAQPAPDRPK